VAVVLITVVIVSLVGFGIYMASMTAVPRMRAKFDRRG
jgi:hypothetical protein